MKHLSRNSGVAGIAAMLVALTGWPAVAANTLSNEEYLALTNRQADETETLDTASGQRPDQSGAVVTSASQATAAAGDRESREIIAARLGVMTPYGKRALVEELRNYYPGAYREFRRLNTKQVNDLVALFVESRNLNQVLANMDQMLSNAK